MRHFLLLLQIQKLGSLTKAAERMATTQPAATSALAEIESMFGGPLFERSGRGMLPTPMGQVVLTRAQAMVHDLTHLVDDLSALSTGQATRLHVGITPFVPGSLLSQAIRQAKTDSTHRWTITLHEGTSDQLLPQLADHTLDCLIGRAPATLDSSAFHAETLYRQPPRLIANRRLAARLGRERLDWQVLSELDWIMGAQHTPMREQVDGLFVSAGTPAPVPMAESHSARLVGDLIVDNERAVSIVPADIAEELVRIAGVAVVPYSFDWQLAPIALITRADRQPGSISQPFMDALRQVNCNPPMRPIRLNEASESF